MGYITIKPDPEKDLYVIFSSVTDTPICWGSAEQMLKWAIHDQFANKFTKYGCFPDNYAEVLARADEHGHSSRIFHSGWLEEDGINWGGYGNMPRKNIITALELLESGKKVHSKKILALVEPFDHGDE